MNYMRETRNYIKRINKDKDSSYNVSMRETANKLLNWYKQKPSSLVKDIRAILDDVIACLDGNESPYTISQDEINEQIIDLVSIHTEVSLTDTKELIILLSKYTNAIELFVYHNRNKFTDLDVIKLFIVHEIHLRNTLDQSCHYTTREMQIV